MTSPMRVRNESGTALVEFAFVLPLLLVLVLGIVDFGRAFNYWIDSTHLANVAARYAAVNQNPGAAASLTLQRHMELQASTKELRTGSKQSTPVDVCISFPLGTSNVGDPVKVEVTSTWSWLRYLVGRTHLTSKTLKGSATMRLEAKPTKYSAGCV
jgi:Flp pilus assembly protein TadG